MNVIIHQGHGTGALVASDAAPLGGGGGGLGPVGLAHASEVHR